MWETGHFKAKPETGQNLSGNYFPPKVFGNHFEHFILKLSTSYLKNVEVEAVVLLFKIDFLSFWQLRQCRAGGQKLR